MTRDTRQPIDTDQHGNEIYDRGTVADLQPEHKPNLQLIQGGAFEIDQVLDHIGVTHDRDSIIAEDSYSSLWVDSENGEYTEVWASYASVPCLSKAVVRLV